MLEMNKLNVRIKFIEEVLGTASNNPDIHEEYIASKAPDAPSRTEEIEAIGVDAAVEKSMTVFAKEDGKPFLWDYHIKGFFKDACGGLRSVKGTESAGIKAYKKAIDKRIFVFPRKIFFQNVDCLGDCQRPLRASTMQGDRVALADSETIPAGSYIDVSIGYWNKDDLKAIKEWLDYGEYSGIGQWRNSGKGRFTWEEIE